MSFHQKLAAAIAEDREKTEKEMATRAKYKIQIWFRSDRSLKAPITFSLSAWQSGKRLHGGGDEMMFICRRHAHSPDVTRSDAKMSRGHKIAPSKRGCGNFIPGEHAVGGALICPHCGVQHLPEEVGDAVLFRLTADKAATVLAQWWRKLESNADLYAKYTPVDPRSIAMANLHDIQTAREKKGLTIYPLKNIINDIANGSTVESRFKAFILA